MKIRSGFVSNSSSSSFIVIGTQAPEYPEFDGYELVIPKDFGGETEFGWEPTDYKDFGSRLNFAYLQTTYVDQQKGAEWLAMLEKVLSDTLYVDTFTWDISDEFGGPHEWGYIDHQSNAGEDRNAEIFDSEQNIIQFLFAPDSMIHTDNDNY